MKIEKLYTLSQFVDEITNGNLSNLETDIKYNSQTKLYLIYKYNLFLQQPLKKDMFVNEIEKPIKEGYQYDEFTFNDTCKAWQEAEKKVIFEMKFNYIPEDDIFYYEGKIVSSLGELAELSNNEFILKNIEL